MTDHQFHLAWSEIPNYTDPDAYISDLALSSMWDDDHESEIPADRLDYLSSLWYAAHMSCADLVSYSGLTRADFGLRYGIDYSTLTKWCLGHRPMPNHVHVMLARLLGLI